MAATNTTEQPHGHGTDTSDLNLDGVPATHRHGVRALRSRIESIDAVSIDFVEHTGYNTVVFLNVHEKSIRTLSASDVRRALEHTGVETAEMRMGSHFSVKLDYSHGFEV
jgi:hypothetical protein